MATALDLKYFAVLSITYHHTPTSVIIISTTNNPSHLTCYYTDKPPVRHTTSRVLRGLALPWGAYWCFVAWQSVEQQEAGDTLIHTFEIPNWLYCQTKWFTFRGTVNSELSPSVTAILKYHKAFILKTEEQTLYDTITGMWLNGHDEANGQLLIISNRTVHKLAFPLSRLNNPTGDVILGILHESDKSIISSKLWGPAMNIPHWPAITWEEVEFDTPQFINELVIIYTQVTGGDAGNAVVGNFQNSDVKPLENRVRYDGSIPLWMQDTLADAAYRYQYD